MKYKWVRDTMDIKDITETGVAITIQNFTTTSSIRQV